MFEGLKKYQAILVTGPQRSGTRVCGKMIARDIGHRYVDEREIRNHDFDRAKKFLSSDTPTVLQAPALCYRAHQLPEDVMVILVRRSIADIVASEKRIHWQHGGSEETERAKYVIEGDEPIAAVKYAFWEKEQRGAIKHFQEVEYESLSLHPMWVPKERRKGFAPDQVEEDKSLRINSTVETFRKLDRKLSEPGPFYFSRYGDADLAIMLGMAGQDQSPDVRLVAELKEAFQQKCDHHLKGLALCHNPEPGMQKGMFLASRNPDFVRLVSDLVPERQEYENAVMFHYIAVFYPEAFGSFLRRHIWSSQKLYVGCYPQETMERLIGPIDRYVRVPPKDCWRTINDWWPKVEEHSANVEMVIPACGVPTRVVQKRLIELGRQVKSIDIGSVIDGFAGVQTRTWVRLAGREWLQRLTSELAR